MQDDPVLGNIPPGAWPHEQAVGYEVARDVVGDCIAAITGVLNVEEKRPQPDRALIAGLNAERAEAARVRRTLRRDDLEAVNEVAHHWAVRLRELDALLDSS